MMKKILAGLAASLVALSAMAFTVSAAGTEDETPAPVDTPAVSDTEAPAATEATPNPGTGNAPIALAAIPVALVAAAVVAKKSK